MGSRYRATDQVFALIDYGDNINDTHGRRDRSIDGRG